MSESQMEYLWQELLKSFDDKPEVAPIAPEPEVAPLAPEPEVVPVQSVAVPISSPQPPHTTQQLFPPLSPSTTSQPLSPPALSSSQLITLLKELEKAMTGVPELQNQSGK